jgi:hypothetical protein
MATPSMARGGHRNPLVHWTKVQSELASVFDKKRKRGGLRNPFSVFCQKRMVEGFRRPPLAIEGVAIEPLAVEGVGEQS